MNRHWFGLYFVGFVIVIFLNFAFTQGDDPRPTFPDTFEVEVQGVFLNKNREVDGSIYYDRLNNRAALSYTYQNVTTTSIYDFNGNEMIYIDGEECSVSEISNDVGGKFFRFAVDKENKKVLAKPEEVFYFSKSILDRQEFYIFPAYIYTAKVDFTQFGHNNCDVSHVFSKPEIEQPDCEGHTCRPTLIAISVKCVDSDGPAEVDNIYNFYRFRSGIRDSSIFQPPVGVYCDITSLVRFPALPEYFSFSYLILEDKGDAASAIGVYSVHRKVWHDSKLGLIRIDEFDHNGFINSSIIVDFSGSKQSSNLTWTEYITVASESKCESRSVEGSVSLHEMTKLPKIFFSKKPSTKDAVYIGMRTINGMEYYVWSLSFIDPETDAKTVQEISFSKIRLNNEGDSRLKISHAYSYIYEKNKDTQIFKRSVVNHLSISNFRSEPKEWEAFDISSCFSNKQKKKFRLKVSGPSIIEGSYTYEDLLERLYMRLSVAINDSVIRISDLKGVFDGTYITDFEGWILDKPTSSVSGPDLQTAYGLIKDAASSGELSVTIKKLEEEINYVVTAAEEIENPINQNSKHDCFRGGSLAAAALIMFVIGISFGIVAYYVFLKKRKTLSNDKVQMSSIPH